MNSFLLNSKIYETNFEIPFNLIENLNQNLLQSASIVLLATFLIITIWISFFLIYKGPTVATADTEIDLKFIQ